MNSLPTPRKILGAMGFFDETEFEKEKPLSSVFSTGTIEFTKKDKKEAERKKDFFQSLKEDLERAQRAKDKLIIDQELNDILTNIPMVQKNVLLHYQASYRDRSIYQMSELRKKLTEQKDQEEEKQKKVSIPSPAKRPNSLEVAFEGASGSKGNLSFQAVG